MVWRADLNSTVISAILLTVRGNLRGAIAEKPRLVLMFFTGC